MAHVKVYDPAVCCSTGVGGSDAQASIAQFTAALDRAKKAGVIVDRFTLAHQPGEYVANTEVKALLDSEGVKALPVVFVDGEIVSKGGYPTRGDLLSKLDIEDGAANTQPEPSCRAPSGTASTGCCS